MCKSEFKRCLNCKHVICIYDGNGGFYIRCKHPQNTRETNYKYATECRGDSLNEYTHWEPDCDMEETNQGIKADAGKPHKGEKTMNKELKSCPFCGGKACIQYGFPNQQKYGRKMVFVKCRDCRAKTETIYQLPFQSLNDCMRQAVQAWNRRSESE